jgi:hypothetical protein
METQELMFFEIFVLLGFKPLEWWKNIMFKHDCLGWGRAPKPIKPNNEKKSEPTSQIGPKIPTHLRDERSSMT